MCAKLKSPSEFDSLIEMVLYFKDEATCLKYVEQWLWDDNIRCRQCGSDKIYRYADGVRLKCSGCKEYFTVKVGTIFESSKLPMIKWFMAIYLIASHKKGISSYQLARDLKITQKTAWFMNHRIRKAMQQEEVQLQGIIEADESFIGGKNKNRHKSKKVQNSQGRSFKDKIAVLGLLERGGIVKTVVVKDTKGQNIKPVVLSTVKENSTLVSDEWHAYHGMNKFYDHQVVDHARGQYVNAAGMTTNGIEGFWAHMKRSLGGIYHKVSKMHLQKYLDEITFRWNTRHMGQGERLSYLISKVNCRLKYKQLTSHG